MSRLSDHGKKSAVSATRKFLQTAAEKRNKHLRKVSGPVHKKDDQVEDVVKMAAATIGLFSEMSHHRKEKRTRRVEDRKQDQDPDKNAPSTIKVMGPDEAAPPQKTKSPSSQADILDAFLMRNHDTTPEPINSEFPLPVAIPERRVKSRSRGSVQAYSPALAERGISQDSFLDLINTLNKVLEPNPYLYAINLADVVGMVIPEPALMPVGIAAGIVADASIETQSRVQSNNFLDRVNEAYFAPSGLMCVVVTWDPDTVHQRRKDPIEIRDTKTTRMTGDDLKLKNVVKSMSSSNGQRQLLLAQLQELMLPSDDDLACTKTAPLV